MANKKTELPVAALAVRFNNEWLPSCTQHVKITMEMNNMMGKYTDVQYNETQEPCTSCVAEDERNANAGKKQ